MDADQTEELRSRVSAAAAQGQPLEIRGGGSKAFYGHVASDAEVLDVGGHQGVLDYEPSELVITVRGGTPLATVEAVLAESGQMLPFEPPRFGGNATIGGAVAAGLSGPGRPWRGAVRDVLLGVRVLDGRARLLRFGGQVMKNVAGYDLSRLMAGAMGTLGVLLEVSLRVAPLPRTERTLALDIGPGAAQDLLRELRSRPVPVSAACFVQERLYLRLAGHGSVLDAFHADNGGGWMDNDQDFWQRLRDHSLPFFDSGQSLWRLSVPPDTRPLDFADDWLVDWGGAQHWIRTSAAADSVRTRVSALGGHAELFRTGQTADAGTFHPLGDELAGLHRRLKSVFDPAGVLNPGRMYAW